MDEFQEALVKALEGVSYHLKYLGNGGITGLHEQGAMEGLAVIHMDAMKEVAEAIRYAANKHAEAMEGLAEGLTEVAANIVEAINTLSDTVAQNSESIEESIKTLTKTSAG